MRRAGVAAARTRRRDSGGAGALRAPPLGVESRTARIAVHLSPLRARPWWRSVSRPASSWTSAGPGDPAPADQVCLAVLRSKHQGHDSAVEDHPQGLLTDSPLAWIVTSKYQYALPLYLQAALLGRFGGDLSRNSLAASVVRVGQAVTVDAIARGRQQGRSAPDHSVRAGHAAFGIDMMLASSVEAHGRSGHVLPTHRGRLPRELALAGITDMAAAIRYLAEHYRPAFNAEFMPWTTSCASSTSAWSARTTAWPSRAGARRSRLTVPVTITSRSRSRCACAATRTDRLRCFTARAGGPATTPRVPLRPRASRVRHGACEGEIRYGLRPVPLSPSHEKRTIHLLQDRTVLFVTSTLHSTMWSIAIANPIAYLPQLDGHIPY